MGSNRSRQKDFFTCQKIGIEDHSYSFQMEGSWNLLENCKSSKGKLRMSTTDALIHLFNKYVLSTICQVPF